MAAKIGRISPFAFSLALSLAALAALPLAAWGAACCGGSVAAPALIVGEERATLSVSASDSRVVADVDTKNIWRRRESEESTSALNLEAARIFADRWQAGGTLPVISRARAGDTESGLGDTSLNLGYEYLPDWDYNPWRPKGLGYIQLTLPTGRSIYESDNRYLLDSRGRGFWALGAGTWLGKAIGRADGFVNLKFHRSLPRENISPGFGGAAITGTGYSVGSIRFGLGVNWFYEDPVDVRGPVASKGSASRWAAGLVSITGSINSSWSGSLVYQDQTWFGRPANTSLSRGVWVQVQRSFPR